MAYPIKVYDDLVGAVADWLNRADLTAVIPVFVQLAEAAFNTDERFRVPQSIVRAQAPIASQFTTLPADYLEMVNLRLLVQSPMVCGDQTIEYTTPADMDTLRTKYAAPGQPRYYTITGNEIEVLPAPDQSYVSEMLYYGMVPALSTSNETNWLIAQNPDLYLYGALIQSAPYLKDDERVQTWAQIYGARAEQLAVSTQRARYGAAPLKMRTRSFG